MNTATTTTIPERPFLKPWYRLGQEEEKLVLEYGQRVLAFEGAAARRLLPPLLALLDGTRDTDAIVHTLGERVRPAVLNALALLNDGGVLAEGPPLDPDAPESVSGAASYLAAHYFDISPSAALTALEDSSVAVIGAGTLGIEIGRLLRLSGVGSVERADGIPATAEGLLPVVAPAPEELPRVADWNEEALARGTPWLQVLPYDGRYASVGPLYVPWETACYVCFQLRRASAVEFTEEFYALKDVPAAWPSSPPLDAAIAGMAATTALRWLVTRDQFVAAGFYALESAANIVFEHHYVRRVPRCPACSGLEPVAPPLPWFKEARDDG